MYSEKIGVVGGFGGYATLEFYQKFLSTFKGETEREYPHIIFDNNFTMPSRTKALLYGDNYDEIVDEISKSIKRLYDCSYIILVCGTAHKFLEDVYKVVPEARSKVVNIIEATARYMKKHEINNAFIIAAEGALKHNIYGNILSEYNINCSSPSENDYYLIREIIESVKHNKLNENVVKCFKNLLGKSTNIILGCTELPTVVKYSRDVLNEYFFLDPLEIVLAEIKDKII